MREKNSFKNKIISCILSIQILTTTALPVVINAVEINPSSLKSSSSMANTLQTAAETSTTIDLTGIQTGGAVAHTHVYEQKYDSINHWEECFICHSIRNNKKHNLVTSGKYGCALEYGYQTQYCSNGCGYNITLPKQAHTSSNWKQDSRRQYHYKVCTVCGDKIKNENCVNAKGQRLGCSTGITGTCVVCGLKYTNTQHAYSYDYGKCRSCKHEAITYTSTSQKVGPYTTRVTWKAKVVSPNITINMDDFSIGTWTAPIPMPEGTVVSVSQNQSTGEFTVVGDIKFSTSNAPKDEDSRCFGSFTMNGIKHQFNMTGQRVNPDNAAPVFQSATVNGNGTASKASQKATLTAKFTEAFDTVVYMALYDTKGKMLSNWGTASRNGTTFTKTFDILDEVSGSKTLVVKAKDQCGNIAEGRATVSYLDSLAPRLTSASTYNTPWTKEKVINFTAQDNVAGGVQIAFNQESDYTLGKYENGEKHIAL